VAQYHIVIEADDVIVVEGRHDVHFVLQILAHLLVLKPPHVDLLNGYRAAQ
jgi:hypothetical protein